MNKLIIISLILLSWTVTVCSILYPENIISPNWLVVTIALVYVCLFAKQNIKEIDTLNPIIIFPLILFLYCYGGIEYFENTSTVLLSYIFSVSKESVCALALSAHIGLLGIACSILIFPINKNNKKLFSSPSLFTPENTTLRKCFTNLLFLMLIITLAVSGKSFIKRIFPIDVHSYAERAETMRLEMGANPLGSVIDVLLIEPTITLLLTFSSLTLFGKKNSISSKLVSLGFIGCFLLTSTLTGFRYWIIYSLTIIVTIYHYTAKKLTLKSIVIGCPTIFIIMNLISFTRNFGSISEIIHAFNSLDKSMFPNLFSLANSSEMQSSTYLNILIDGIKDHISSFNYGSQFLKELGVYIPRIIWPDRPLNISEKFAQIFDPTLFEDGGGFGSFILLEGYWAGGISGVFFTMFIYGYIIQYMHNKLNPSCNFFGMLFFSIFYFLFAVSSTRSGFFSMTKAYLMAIIPFFYLFIYHKMFVNNPRYFVSDRPTPTTSQL